MVAAALTIGLGIGLALGTCGGGGSVLAVPALVYLLGQGVEEATTASLVVVAAGAVAAGAAHQRERRVCWRHAAMLLAASIPGVVAGTLAGNAIGGRVLVAGLAVVILAGAAATWHRSERRRAEPARAACPPLRPGTNVLAGLGVGFLTGLFGIGGGFVIVPTLALALAFPIRLAVGTSVILVTATSIAGLAVHLLAGRSLDPGITISMTAGVVAGAIGGAMVAGRVSHVQLSRAFAGVTTAVASYLLVSTIFLGGPPAA